MEFNWVTIFIQCLGPINTCLNQQLKKKKERERAQKLEISLNQSIKKIGLHILQEEDEFMICDHRYTQYPRFLKAELLQASLHSYLILPSSFLYEIT